MKSRVVFFGTPYFAADILRYLISCHVPIVGIVTQPDRPKGRTLALSSSPVKEAALSLSLNVPIFQPIKASEESFLQDLAALHADLYVVVAYGQILSQKLLSLPPLGCINVHASLLPKHRGAAPMQRSILAGDNETGVAIQKMVKQMDAGDVIATAKVQIPKEMTLGELEERLREASKPLLLNVLQAFDDGIPNATPQDHSLATYAAKIDPAEGEIDWNQPAEKIHCLIRAFSPRPGAWCWLESNSKKMKILRADLVESSHGKPGEVISRDGIVACGQASLRLIEVQPEGKKAMAWADWLRGASDFHRFPVCK